VSCTGRIGGIVAMVDVASYPDDVVVRELGRRFRCSACGSRNVDARPDWIQYANHYRALPESETVGCGQRQQQPEQQEA
jgi:hypothetical protein